jgi:Ca2+-binding RTX toxin-like protein
MYTDFIAAAYGAGAEFVTLADLAQRIESFEQAKITYTTSGNVVTASVISGDAGKFALDFDGGYRIQKVTGWYAYDDDSVFLPRAGGQFEITLGAAPDDVTHIVALPARGELLSVTGDGTNLAFSVMGDGKVVIDLKNPAGQHVSVQGAEIVSLVGDRLELELADPGRNDVTVTIAAEPPPPVDHAPVITSNGGGDNAAINLAENTLAVTTVTATDQDGGALTYALANTPDAALFTIDPATGALAFKAAPDFEAPGDADKDNRYDVVVEAIDGTGLKDTQALAIAVTDVAGVTLTGNSAANTLNGTPENDTLNGAGGSDTLNGLGGNDFLVGGNGHDILVGGPGDDILNGSSGNDRLIGGPGADTLTGGFGRDVFVYASLEEAGTLAARDLITDFQRLSDRIDLSAIDANSGVAGDQAFQFLAQQGAAFTGAGQVRFVHDAAANKTYVEANVDANLGADFSIELNGIVQLTQANFGL